MKPPAFPKAPEAALPPWAEQPEALALLESMVANPPRMVEALSPLSVIFAGGPERCLSFDRNDDRVEALRFLADAAFFAAELAGPEALALHRAEPRLDEIIAGYLSSHEYLEAAE
jgi:hypothetical protein